MKSSREFIPAGKSLDAQQSGGFLALTLIVDNPTNQWLYESNSNRYVPPYFGGVVISIGGTQAIGLINRAPPGITQAPPILGQVSTAMFTDVLNLDAPGTPLVTPRSNYYDRNGLAVANSYGFTQNGTPLGLVARWVYTTPSGRRTKVSNVVCKLVRDGAPAAAGLAEARVRFIPSGQQPVMVASAALLSTAIGAADSMDAATDLEMSAGDIIAGEIYDLSSGGSIQYMVAWSGTEFDA